VHRALRSTSLGAAFRFENGNYRGHWLMKPVFPCRIAVMGLHCEPRLSSQWAGLCHAATNFVVAFGSVQTLVYLSLAS
jgi:hypothetical protein